MKMSLFVVSISAPIYLDLFSPSLVLTDDVITINWTHSFRINGEIEAFVLYENDIALYRGLKRVHSFRRDDDTIEREFVVELRTDHGLARSAAVVLSPSVRGKRGRGAVYTSLLHSKFQTRIIRYIVLVQSEIP